MNQSIVNYCKPKPVSDEALSDQFAAVDYSRYKSEIVELVRKTITVSKRTLEILDNMHTEYKKALYRNGHQ